MQILIDWLAKQTIKYIKRPFVLFTIVVILAATVFIGYNSSLIAGRYEDNGSYIVLNISEFEDYTAKMLHGAVYIDWVEIPTPSYKGILIKLDKVNNCHFVEMHLDSAEYDFQFYKERKYLGSISVSSIKSERIVINVPDKIVNIGYDSVKLIPLSGSKFGLGYIRFINAHEDNVVLQEIKDSGLIRAQLENGIEKPFMIQGIQAFFVNYSLNLLDIEISNIHDRDVELLNIENANGDIIDTFKRNTYIEYTNNVEYAHFQFFDCNDDLFENMADIYIRYRIEGAEETSVVQLIPYKRFDDELFEATNVRVANNMDTFPFIKVQNDTIFFEGEVISIDKALFIPEGYKVNITKNQQIDLIDGAYIVSRSPIVAEGTMDKPITIHSSDKTGRGLFVCQANEDSMLSNLIFDGLNTPVSGTWQLTGAVTFYESDVVISSCVFENNLCEDALNVVRSKFIIRDSIFRNTFGDAFDSDFSQGEFFNTQFSNTGNDACDVSTSTINLDTMYFYNIGDKAISGGEQSTVVINNAVIDHSIIGIASKDSSNITGDNVKISNTEIAYTLYRKKPEFNGGYINITHSLIEGNIGLEYLIEPGSALWLNGNYIQPKSASKEALLIEKMINGEPIF